MTDNNNNQTVVPALVFKSAVVAAGDNLSYLFQQAGLGKKDFTHFLNTATGVKYIEVLQPGQTIEFEMDQAGELQRLRLVRNKLESELFTRIESGFTHTTEYTETTTRTEVASGTISRTLYDAALSSGMDHSLIYRLTDLFAWDINFALDVRQGDSFKVLYERLYVNGEKVATGKILAAQFINRGQPYHAFYFTDSTGNSDYYNLQGVALRSDFLQAPLDYRRVSSEFNPRRLHPIAKVVRPHRGTDYAAARGTPVWTTGDGVVTQSSYSKANGNYIFVQHGSQYETRYLHLNARLVKVGDKVQQKQIIGQVGATGLATGPHLHYEFLQSGRYLDPRKVVPKMARESQIGEMERSRFLQQSQALLARFNEGATANQLATLKPSPSA